MKETTYKHLRNYLFLLVGLTTTFTAIAPSDLRTLGPTLFMILGFPVFAITFGTQFYKFSQLVKSELPNYFENNKITIGYWSNKMLNALILLNYKAELSNLNGEPANQFELSRKLMILTLASFFLVIPIVLILTV